MAGGGFRLKVNLDDIRDQVDFIKSWKQRLKKVEPMFGYLAANYIKEHVQSKLRGSQNKDYRRALEVVRVKGTKPGEYAYAVQLNEHDKAIRQVQPNKQLIFVAPTKRMMRSDPGVLILQKYSPWTVDTLPFKPDNRVAVVTAKTVKAMDVIKTTQLRTRQRHLWARDFSKVGVKVPARPKAINFSKQTASLPNIALDALKQEFGLGPQKPNPSWRMAFSHLAKTGFAGFMKDRKQFVYPLTRPSFNVWRKWPPPTKHSISVPQAKKFQAFQRKIAPKTG